MQERNLIIKSSLGSVFSSFSDEQLKSLTSEGEEYIAICGSVKSPGIIKVEKDSTLKDIIDLAGGILNNSNFKAAQLGIPFGGFLNKGKLNEKFDFSLFDDINKTIIILSDEDCIIQYTKFYIEYLFGKLDDEGYTHYKNAKKEITNMWEILDRISKGRGNIRDVYLLRNLSYKVKKELNQKHNLVHDIIHNFYDEIKEHIENGKCYTLQCNHLTKLTITDKCIGCGMCKTVCPVDCIHGEKKQKHYIDYNLCTHCGQCLSICPVDAITAGNNTLKFLRDLSTPNKTVITQMAPAVRVAIGEAFGFEAGVNVEKKIAAGLKKLGVDYVFDTTFAADLTIMEEAKELEYRLNKYFNNEDVNLPILTSCCPAWVKFIEQNYPDMLDVPSSSKSPMQMFATVAKDIWAKEKGYERESITCVSIMPCIAKKYEASRPEFSRGLNYDVDYVITTDELIRIFKDSNINLGDLEDKEIDNILGEYTGGGIIFGRTGGVIEAATRVAVENMTGRTLEKIEFTELRGWDGFRSCELNVNNMKLKIGVTHGLKEAKKMLDKIRSGEEFFHAIEIMACTGGCVGGGGQPKLKKKDREDTLKKRAEGLNNIDKSKEFRKSNENPMVINLYENYLDYPMSNKAKELLHTRYFKR